MIRNVSILGMGKYLPNKVVTADEMDSRLNLTAGWTLKKSRVKIRHHVENETASDMAVQAIYEALHNANIEKEELDCIISVAGTYEQPIPCNACLIKEKLEFKNNHIPAFDINSTCLSFVVGLDTMSCLVDSGRFNTVLLVSSDISSVGINYNHKESCVLFGDGASATVIRRSEPNCSSKILSSRIETYEEGAHFTEIRSGGSKCHARNHNDETKEDFLFYMDGRAVFKLSLKVIDSFVQKLLAEANLTMNDISLVVPHQASGMALNIMKKHLGICDEKFMDIIENHGNVIAASIPMALYEAIKQGKICRGDRVMLLGTSAGLSLGGVILEY